MKTRIFWLLWLLYYVANGQNILIASENLSELFAKNPIPRLTPAGVIIGSDISLDEPLIVRNVTEDEVWVQINIPSQREKVKVQYYLNGEKREEELYANKIESIALSGTGEMVFESINGARVTAVWQLEKQTTDFGTSGSCNVNARCPEGDNYQLQRRAVVRMNVPIGGFIYYCTGAMINNTAMDKKPYLLSAEHCVLDDNDVIIDSAALASIIFRFNWESPTCANPSSQTGLPNQIVTGGRLRARSNDGGGATGSDMLLLELAIQPPASYNVFYAGWNRSNIPALGGAGIHHPSGDIKKISTFTMTLQSGTFQQAAGAFWLVNWVATQSGHGVTEGGSSGSPLFNSAGEIVGTLTGGSASCNFRTGTDFYGKFWYHWDKNGTTNNRQLKPWLDPLNTGVTSLAGLYVGQEEFYKDRMHWTLMPNPAKNGRITLRYEGTEACKDAEVSLVDLSGRVLLKEQIGEVETGHVHHFVFNKPGVYLIGVRTDKHRWYEKVVVAD